MRLALLAAAVLLLAACGGGDDADVAGEEAASVELAERNDSAVSGTATYEPVEDGGVRITVEVSGERIQPLETEPVEPYPVRPGATDEPLVAQVRRGSCDDPGDPVDSLGQLSNGSTTDRVAPGELSDGGDFVILVTSRSAEQRQGGETGTGSGLLGELSASEVKACGEVADLGGQQ